jgi:adenine-specific DNA methylase
MPRPDDVFQERLYCIQWAEFIEDENGKINKKWHYKAPTAEDFRREEKVLELLNARFQPWQEKGYIPRRKIEPGSETTRLQRERGWTYWHHLFTPRQLLLCGLVMEYLDTHKLSPEKIAMALLGVGRCLNYMARLSTWHPAKGNENVERVFTNQALNTLSSYASRSWPTVKKNFLYELPSDISCFPSTVLPIDARQGKTVCDFWITDPPYADAVNYEEITEFFLAWYDVQLTKSFPSWYSDSKRALAVKGADLDFRKSMIESYKRLAQNMPENGMQIVMFTHQDAAVWADLSMILWAAGLRVTAAWTIATETSSELKQGNYVQGTVLLVLRKRIASEPLFLDEVNHRVENEVRRQLDEMTRLEDDSDPNFGDSDYQLAAYAAALRVLTGQPIEEINPEKEILRPRKPGETGPVEALIRRAVKIACDHLVPRALDGGLWKQLNPAERFYLKGLEVESHGEYRAGVYQELARGFGANDYTDLLESSKANETRLKSASEFGKKGLSGEGFSGSLVRQCLFAVAQVSKSEETREGLNYLKTELPDYWASREKISHILDYLAGLKNVSTVEHWHKDAASASLLLGAVRNDHV